MKGSSIPDDIRRNAQKAMIAFICETSLYNVHDIATIIHEPSSLLKSILQENSGFIDQGEINLIKLYSIALELYKGRHRENF